MNSLPAISTSSDWIEFLRERLGERWVIANRLTDRLRRSGYRRAVTQKQYRALEHEWETRKYGAPLKTLQEAAPAMLAALRETRDYLCAMTGSGAPHDEDRPIVAMIEAAISAAEGRS